MASDTGSEVEFKWGIPSKAALDTFLAHWGGAPAAVVQTNHFFDTADFALDAERRTFRLRNEDGQFVVTIKGPGTVTGQLAIRPEIEWDVPVELAEAALRPGADPGTLLDAGRTQLDEVRREAVEMLLSPAGDRPLMYVGRFENRRIVVDAELDHDGATLPARFEVDTTVFDGGPEQYEIELEVAEEQQAAYDAATAQLFAALGIETTQNPSKSTRFFEVVKRARGG